MRLLKTIHSWLGVIVLPWVLIIGLTGLFLNHEGLVMGVLLSGAIAAALAWSRIARLFGMQALAAEMHARR
mgnify:CR=1 FL=1